MENHQHITLLFKKYLANEYTDDELDELLRYFEMEQDHDLLQARIKQQINEAGDADEDTSRIDHLVDAVERKLKRRLAERKSRIKPIWRRPIYVAASLLLFVSIGIGSYWYYTENNHSQTLLTSEYGEDIPPGTNRATLTLADGRTIDLSEAHTGIVVGEDLVYNDGSEVLTAGKERLLADVSSLMSVSTPKGGTYQVTLPDGSKVWLNSASTLNYPSRFSGEERVVELIGEAYFDVAKAKSKNAQKQAWPFQVVSKGQRVEVLGTQFNISAYPDEPTTKTTLVEGSVAIRPHGASASWRIVPGEQGQLTDGTIETQQVNTLKYTSWKDGLFYFRDAGIDEVVSQLERWYDVEVVYAGDKPTNQFTGEIPRNRNASEVLAMLEYFGVQYRISGKTITLSNNQFK